jgi:putative copper export protein
VYLYLLTVTLHLLAALFWLGGMFFLALVAAPVVRQLPVGQRAELFKQLGVRFRCWGWVAIGVLLVSGAANLHLRGVLNAAVMGSAEFWSSPFGRALFWKLGLVTAMIVLSALHDFWLGPAASRLPAESAQAFRLRRGSSWIARINAILGIVLLIVAARLARGGIP